MLYNCLCPRIYVSTSTSTKKEIPHRLMFRIYTSILSISTILSVTTLKKEICYYCKMCNVNKELIFPNLPNGFKMVKLKMISYTIFVGKVWQTCAGLGNK